MKPTTAIRLDTLLWFLLVPFWLLGCESAPGGSTWTGVVTDSAGVSIVSNPEAPLWREGEAWSVVEELTIGAPADGPSAQFGHISGVDVDSAGRIYVLDRQAQAVSVFDPQGQFVRSLGRPGAGPGEISPYATDVFVTPQGAVLLTDVGNLRVNVYTESGEAAGARALHPGRGEPLKWGMASDGRLVVQFKRGRELRPGGEMVFALGPDGAVADTILIFPWGEDTEGSVPATEGIVVFAPGPLWDLPANGDIYSAVTSDYRIRVHGPDGHIKRIVTKVHRRPVVSDAEKARIRTGVREELEARGTPPEFIAQMLTGFGVADYYPAFAALRSGPWGSFLVQTVLPIAELSERSALSLASDPAAIRSGAWDVFDADGRYLGVLDLPYRFTPFSFRGDKIYGVWLDDFDIQYVKRLRIVRPEPLVPS